MAGAPGDRKETCLQTLPLLPVNQLGEKGKELERGGAALGCTKGLSIFLFSFRRQAFMCLCLRVCMPTLPWGHLPESRVQDLPAQFLPHGARTPLGRPRGGQSHL